MGIRATGILASAGTGKTYALTTELLRLLVEGHPPESIFAATFTKTAAGEILERILRRLCDAASSQTARKELAAAIGKPALSSADCQRLAAVLARSLDRLAI